MDVTQEIRKNHIYYGASDNTAPWRHASGKSLNYAAGPSIMRPDRENVSVIPRLLKYESAVGLFGAENYFVRVNLNIQNNIKGVCYEELYWECSVINYNVPAISDSSGYYNGTVDGANTYPDPDVDTYYQARINDLYLPDLGSQPFVSVDLTNLKTGNKYVDCWVDMRLYTSDREEHGYDKMYVPANGFFYIGIHARNTRRLPFDIECYIGEEYRTYESIEDKRLVMNSRARGPHY